MDATRRETRDPHGIVGSAINVAGAGSPDYLVAVYGNTLVRPDGEHQPAGYQLQIPTSDLNIQRPLADGFVDLEGDAIAPTANSWTDAF
jgi:hypothetical protein